MTCIEALFRIRTSCDNRRQLVASTIGACLLAAACSRQSSVPASAGGDDPATLRRSIGAEPASLDPQVAGDTFSFEVLRDVFEGLTAESVSGEVIPGEASTWSVSADGKSYTFTLRHGLRWSDGRQLTADSFVDGIQRAVDPSIGGPNVSLLELVARLNGTETGPSQTPKLAIAASDPRTLRIELKAPAPFFPAILSNAIAYPRYPGIPESADASSRLVSNGAYRLVRRTPGGNIVLERNPYYWDAASVRIPRVEYTAIADSSVELLRYRADQLDMTSFVPAQQLDELRREKPRELQIRPQLAVVYYAFNMTSAAIGHAKGLREALTLAIDREQLSTAILKGGQVPAYGFVPPGIAGYSNPRYEWRSELQDARVKRARALLVAAGITAAHPLQLRLLCPEDDTLKRVALAAAAMWRESLGVDVSTTFLEYRAFLAARERRAEWDVISHGWNADYPDPGNFLGVFASESPQNDGRAVIPGYDLELSAIRAEADGAKRLELLAQAEQTLLEDYAIAPLYFAVSRRLVKPRVEGATLSPMNHNYSKYLSLH